MERKKVIFIVSRFPYPLVKGDKLRAFHQIRKLSESCDVYLIALSDEKISRPDIEALEPYCKEVIVHRLKWTSIFINLLNHLLFTSKPVQVGYFFNKGINKKILSNIKDIQPNHVFCQLIRTSEYAKSIKGIPKTLDYMDALSAGMERRKESAAFFLKWLFNIEASRLKIYEHRILKEFDSATVISKSDRDLIFHYENQNIIVLPNGIDKDYFNNQGGEKNYDLLFTGNMSYPPNIQSAVYLVEEIMPLVWKELPNCKLLISGATPTKKIKSLEGKNVIIRPWIDDIRKSYSESQIFIAPMLIGSGMQNKLLEAMSMKLPCITSDLANKALGAVHEQSILVGKNKKEYCKHIIFLINNKEVALDIAEKGHNFVIQNFDWNRSNEILLNLIVNDNGRTAKSN